MDEEVVERSPYIYGTNIKTERFKDELRSFIQTFEVSVIDEFFLNCLKVYPEM
jgi:hypothetical protein